MRGLKGFLKNKRTNKALANIEPLFTLANYSQLGDSSLFTPRGFYKRIDTQYLTVNNGGPGIRLQEEFYKEFERNYSEDVIRDYLMEFFANNKSIKASEIIKGDMSEEAVLKLLYILVYAGDELDYYIQPLDEYINHTKFKLADFEIIRGYDV